MMIRTVRYTWKILEYNPFRPRPTNPRRKRHPISWQVRSLGEIQETDQETQPGFSSLNAPPDPGQASTQVSWFAYKWSRSIKLHNNPHNHPFMEHRIYIWMQVIYSKRGSRHQKKKKKSSLSKNYGSMITSIPCGRIMRGRVCASFLTRLSGQKEKKEPVVAVMKFYCYTECYSRVGSRCEQ